ncbi:MAG: hypothetical protein JO264_00330, partial [Acidisphaera sp.]|nr:hypothetical protein [Acidisphaera sp.]
AWWLLALLLGACGGGGGDPMQARCNGQVDRDPEVRRLRMLAAGSPYLLAENQKELTFAVRQARLKCLQDQGLAPPGGVEPVKPVEGEF